MKRKIANEIAFAFSLIAFFTTLILTFILSRVNIDALRLSAKDYAVAIADEITRDINSKTQELKNTIDAIMAIFNDPKLTVQEKIDYVKMRLSFQGMINYVGIYNPEGTLVDQFSEPGRRIHKTIEEKIKSRLADADILYNTFYPEGDSFPVLELTLPWRLNKELLGYLSAGLDLSWLSQYLRELSLRRFGMDDLIYIVNQDGIVIAHSNVEFVKENRDMSQMEIFKKIKNLKSLFSVELALAYDYIDYKKRKVLGTVISIPTLGWGIVVSQLHGTVYAGLKRLYMTSLFVGLFCLCLAVVSGIFSSRYLTHPVEELNAGVKRVIMKDFEHPVVVKVKNEIGELANSFNEMIKRLKQYREEIIKETETKSFIMRYLPTHLAAQIIASGKEKISTETLLQEASVMFVDITGFTSLTEKLSPEKLTVYLNKFFTIAVDCIFKYNGMIDKFIGDCVMALFGVPYPSPDSANDAVRAAREIIKSLEEKNGEFEKECGYGIKVKISIATGNVFVGNIGSKTRLDYTAIGPAVNLSSRLEEFAGDNEIIIDETTKTKLSETIKTEEKGFTEVRGIKGKVRFYGVVS